MRVASRDWIAEGHLPLGGIVLLAGDTNLGKSPLAYHWLACVTAGKPFAHDVPVISKPMRALLLSGEGELSKDVHPRLIAAGVNKDLVMVFDCVAVRPDITLASIPEILRHNPDVKFVVVDPLSAFCHVGSNSPYKVRQMLAPFHKLANERGVTFVFVHHVNKSRNARNPLGLISGSKSWTDNAPTVWQLERCNQNGDCVLELTKGRGMARPFPSYEVSIESDLVDGVAGTVPVAVVGDKSNTTISTLMDMKRPDVQHSAVGRALDWLREYLKGNPRLQREIFEARVDAGHSEAAVVRAKALGKISHRKRVGDGLSEWFDSVDGVDPVAAAQLDQLSQTTHAPCDYTPKSVMDALHACFGRCALDPASPAVPVHVQCRRWYTKADDGLSKSWAISENGWLFLNPPWGSRKEKVIHLWVAKALREFEAGNVKRMVLLIRYRRTRAFDKLFAVRGAQLFNLGGLKFGAHKVKHPTETALFLIGFTPEDGERLQEAFERHGVKPLYAANAGATKATPAEDNSWAQLAS